MDGDHISSLEEIAATLLRPARPALD